MYSNDYELSKAAFGLCHKGGVCHVRDGVATVTRSGNGGFNPTMLLSTLRAMAKSKRVTIFHNPN